MPLVELNLQSLNDLDDGRVATGFVHELKRVVLDCMDRPGDKAVRQVSLVFNLTPVIDPETGDCEGAHGEFRIQSKTPERKSKTYSFGLNKKGHLSYSSESPENVDQTTFDDIDPDTGRINRK